MTRHDSVLRPLLPGYSAIMHEPLLLNWTPSCLADALPMTYTYNYFLPVFFSVLSPRIRQSEASLQYCLLLTSTSLNSDLA
jgi:hypothetical protein